MGWWKKMRLGFLIAMQVQMLMPMWPSVKGKMKQLADSDPEVSSFVSMVEDLLRQAKRLF